MRPLRIHRPALAARVRSALDRGAVLLVAGAGYGKTTILEEALEGAEPVAWITCTPASRDPRHLLFQLVSAVAAVVLGLDDVKQRLLAAGQWLEPGAALIEVLGEIEALVVDPLFIVLDDAEYLADEALVMAGLLLQLRSRAIRVVLSSRRPLELRLAKARVTQRLEELRFADLAFDEADCTRLVEAGAGFTPDPDTVDAIMSATEGWPLAVAAVALSLRRSEPARWSSATASSFLDRLRLARDVRSFVIEEVLDGLQPDVRHQVLDSAVPQSLSPSVAAALGLPDTFQDAARSAGLFLRPIDGGRTFVYHPLLRDCLLERLVEERPADHVADLHRRAAGALEAAFPAEAIDHWLAAGDFAAAAAALLHNQDELLSTSPRLVRGWVDRLTSGGMGTAPAVQMLSGRLCWAAGDFDGAIEQLTSVVRDDGRTVGSELRWGARLLLMQVLFLRGRFEEAIDLAAGLTTHAPEEAPFAARVGMSAAHSLAALGRAEESDAAAERARALAGTDRVATHDLLRRSYIDLPTGRLDGLRDEATSMLGSLDGADALMRINLHTLIAFNFSEAGRLTEAIDRWRIIETEARSALMSFMVDASRAWQALLLAQTGRLRQAEDILATVGAIGPGWLGYAPEVARATVASARGDRASALGAADRALDAVATAAPVYRVLAAADLVPAVAATGALERATEILTTTERLVDGTYPGRSGSLFRARLAVLRSWLAQASGEIGASDRALRLAFEVADEPLHHVARRHWAQLQPLVWSGLERNVLDPARVVRLLHGAFPAGLEFVPFIDHPDATVRRAALAPALASGHPSALTRVAARRRDPDPDVAGAASTLLDGGMVVSPPRTFTTLGGFAVRRGEWRIDENGWGRPAAARLVRFLLVQHGRPIPEDVLLETFWPDLSPAGARHSLHVAVSRIRSVLDLPTARRSVIEAADGSYVFRPDEQDVIDSVVFERAAAAALAQRPHARDRLEHVVALWTGEPLPEDRYADWATSWRERLVDRYAALLAALIDSCRSQGNALGAMEAARRLVALDPYDEGAQRELMTAYMRAGRRAAALRQFVACRRRLVDDLGVEPAAETLRLRARILNGEEV